LWRVDRVEACLAFGPDITLTLILLLLLGCLTLARIDELLCMCLRAGQKCGHEKNIS
jgi:hypothetical protein